MVERNLVFLGHATPQDNAFTLWLGARLSAAGYEVWFDLEKLKGGETFWQDIADALRKRTAVYVPIMSVASINPARRGFHDELQIGVDLLRGGRKDFIIPARLDPILSSDTPPQLVQINYVDFSRGWATGLGQLLDALEKNSVPRSFAGLTANVSAWKDYQAATSKARTVIPQHGRLASNWFELRKLPGTLRLLGSPHMRDVWEPALQRVRLPHTRHGDLLLTFASADAVAAEIGAGFPVREVAVLSTEEFLSNGCSFGETRILAGDGRRMIADICNRAWEHFATARGLVRHEMSGQSAWYFPLNFAADHRAYYRNAQGKETYRQLVGRKGKRGVTWHFALSGRFELRNPRRLQLRSHVLFGQGGTGLLTDGKKNHRLRRALCKNWWNDAWRDRLEASVAFLAEGRDTLELPVGDAAVEVSARSLRFATQWSFDREQRPDEAEDSSDYEFDEEFEAVLAMPDSVEEDMEA